MSLNIEQLELYILTNNIDKLNEFYEKFKDSDNELLSDIVKLAYNNIVSSNNLKSIESINYLKQIIDYKNLKESKYNTIIDYLSQINRNIEDLQEHENYQILVLLVGITFLNLYVQLNWTGPTLAFDQETKELFDEKFSRKEILDSLEVDGEYYYSKAQYPVFLQIARCCLVDNYSYLSDLGCKSSCWWSSRTLMYHQKSLSNPTPTIKSLLNERFQIVVRSFGLDQLQDQYQEIENKDTLIDLAARAKLEQSLVFNYFKQLTKLKESIKETMTISDLQLNLIGAMGRRTRYQTFDTPQLVLNVNSNRTLETSNNNNSESKSSEEGEEDKKYQGEVTNEDKTLLARPTILDKKAEGDRDNIRLIDQAIILASCLNVKNQNSNNGLVTEEMMPYIHASLAKSNNWIVHSMGLLIKSRLEIQSTKTSERAALQIQALLDQFDDPSSTASQRLSYIYSVDYPSRWDMEKEVAERYIQLGAVASAFDIFERLEMWDEAIKCLTFMGKNSRSEELVRQRLNIHPTPELYCVLGDLKEDPAFYLQGWELSKRRYSRAQRSLARYHLKREEYQECIDCFQLALSINPLFPESWFTLGCAAMRLEKWDIGTNAFSRVVSLEPEEGEAWANLASIYMHQNKLDKAYVALQEGLKQKRENWKMWENFLYVCMKVGEYQQAIQAILRIFDLADKRIDRNVLEGLSLHVQQNKTDRSGLTGRQIEKPVTELFEKITARLTNDPIIWRIYSHYHLALGHMDKAIDLAQKSCRWIEAEGWESDKLLFPKVAEYNTYLVNLYFDNPTAQTLYSSRLKIQGILKKSEEYFNQTETYQQLKTLLDKIKEKENSLSTTTTTTAQ
ncbi:tetratricopeptide repeat domain 27 [Tieghemostelium lacteum]|uniref:Tetratricopeptide repeat domain 27 n=1 Tax=Tieghemostelium lacteum TaxID=361077 RepID=A0A152A8V6_TIELA|nr:tetratricopeptide repeat domain 27 [Tieghemostelium lacteum]|eukprot:KYR02648.1 tetratricopeptide repeat domain 27 [Tieghemostelium lacteum]